MSHVSLDKLSGKSIQCIFLGYTHLQKGYKCYSPENALPVPCIGPPESSFSTVHPLQVYHHRNPTHPLADSVVPDNSLPTPTSSSTSKLSPADSPPLAIRKVMHLLIRSGDKPWLMRWMPYTIMALGIWFPYLLAFDGYIV
ncbi:Retrovirus-related Pol polyprotein from transposon TNT 1-94 [Quillaja saponaria]|uniref:Retrovirus-related Pol polyprotein from transposon TNT 1-94 n=1 Tax=Quillaja saponaria TaxID=32244 RepID=A0AAD7LJJ1_QUISA|nr:Retrovirus-related Pol polyprotein from transposon TNT 1-94 [Quillaja saponaria]